MTTSATFVDAAGGDSPTSTRGMVLAFVLPLLLLLPFMNRAYNIDDPMFVWMAQHIAEHPADFFGSAVEKGNADAPMYEYSQNPPGFAYYLAPFGVLGSWRESALHFAVALFAGLAGLGVYRLAGRLGAWPGPATAITVLTPGFLVSAATVMADVPMVALYVWAVYLWVRGLDENRTRYFVTATAVATAAVLFKYFAITLVPLLLAYSLLRRKRLAAADALLLVPVVVLALLIGLARLMYGVDLLAIAAEVAQDPEVRRTDTPSYRVLIALVFLGGCFAPLAFYAPLVYPYRLLLGAAAVMAALLAPLIEGYSAFQLLLGIPEPFDWTLLAHFGLMGLAGVFIVSIVGLDLRRRWGPESILLALWVLGTLAFVVRVNHLINARVLLPLAPAASILLLRAIHTRRRSNGPLRPTRVLVLLVPAALVSLWVALGDRSVAENARRSALRAAEIARASGSTLYYSGLWGFQYYVQREGASVLNVEFGGPAGGSRPKMQTGDLLAVSSDGREQWRPPPQDMVEVEIFSYRNPFSLATYHPTVAAGFYSHLAGIVPYFVGPMPPEEYGLYRWTGPGYRAHDADNTDPGP